MNEPQNTDDGPTGPSDEDLMAMGLARTKAWVRVTETGPARRNKRYRKRAAAQGQRQLSTPVPDEARETVRQICRRLCDGDLSLADLAALQAGDAPQSGADQAPGAQLTAAAARSDRKRIIRQILKVASIGLAAFTVGMTIAFGLR